MGPNLRFVAWVLAVFLNAGAGMPGPGISVETRSFEVQPGDTLVVRNDFGSVRVVPWHQPRLEARITRSDEAAGSIDVAARKEGDKIYIYAFFQESSPGRVDLEVQAPSFINVTIWGANPEVELSGIAGLVRVQTFTGTIAAENLTSSAALTTESGDIWLRARIQPLADIRLESVSGNILCEVRESFNFRGWTRAGGRLTWSPGFAQDGGQYEQQVGTGGPLLYAASMRGNVRIHFEPASAMQEITPPTPPQAPVPQPARTESSAPPPAAGDARPPDTPAGGTLSPSGTYSVKVNVDWVYLNVSVRDRYTNRSIPNLRRDEFLAYEDAVLQDVQQFESTEAPFNLLLLLDMSGSTRSHIDLIKEASIDFTREIKANDRIAVATFNSKPRLIQNFTGNRGEAADAIRRIRSGGGTAFYDALDISIKDYIAGLEGRTAIVVFSDGVDNQLTGDFSNGSSIEFEELFRNVQETDAIIYTIFLDTEGATASRGTSGGAGRVAQVIIDILSGGAPPTQPRSRVPPQQSGRDPYVIAREQMEMIAEQTGGRIYSPRRIEDLAHTYSEIADDLRIQYRLGYNSTNRKPQGGWHSVGVKIEGRPEAVARTRKGYYARPDSTKTASTRP